MKAPEKPRKVFRRWQRRKQKLLTELPTVLGQCQAEGSPAQVHGLRVTLRRLRLVVRVGRKLFPSEALTAFRAWGRGISKLTSQVRDLDVAVEWLQAQSGAEEVIELCQRRRAQLWKGARGRLKPLPGSLLLPLANVKPERGTMKRLAGRMQELSRRYAEAVQARAPLFFQSSAKAQHEFRRTVRFWRYLRELELPRRLEAEDPLLQALAGVQEATGERQNLQLARAALRRFKAAGQAAGLLRAVAAHLVAQDGKIRESFGVLGGQRRWGRGWPDVRGAAKTSGDRVPGRESRPSVPGDAS